LEKTIEQAYRLSGETQLADRVSARAEARRQAVIKYCWNEEEGYFRDYDFVAGGHTEVLSLAGVFPLAFKMAEKDQALRAASFIEEHFLKAGGVVSTLNDNGQQWDYPNGWAPLQWMTIEGLRNYDEIQMATMVKDRWIALNKRVYKQTGKMVEKYNVVDMTLEAGGGEYPVQDGFGWSNGVLLKLLSE
jgi:alpha,alpha-trehalase